MTQAAEKLKVQLDQLSADERAELAGYLICSLDDEQSDGMSEAEFNAELMRRNDDFESGRDRGRPAAEVIQEIRKKYL